MEKRKILFGDYDTAAHGWTLTGWQLSPAEQKTHFVDKPGGDGSWDLSTALTDGLARYHDRTLAVTLETSEGDRLAREAVIRGMVNQLDGQRLDIRLPDDSDHYITGRIHVAREYNDTAHAAVSVSAVCDPWKYCEKISGYERITFTESGVGLEFTNTGRRAAVPTFVLSSADGAAAEATLQASHEMPVQSYFYTLSVTSGTYKLPALQIPPGGFMYVSVKGTPGATGQMYIREAVLE